MKGIRLMPGTTPLADELRQHLRGKAKGAVGEAIEEYGARTRRYLTYTPAAAVRKRMPGLHLDHAYRDNEHCLRDTIVVR